MVRTITVETKRVENMLSGYAETIPEAGNRGAWNLAQFAARALKEEAKEAGLRPWGGGTGPSLFSHAGTFAKKKKVGEYHVMMPQHGKKLDKGNYFIHLKRGRLINKWVMDKWGAFGKGSKYRRKTGLSIVKWGPRGGIRWGSIYVSSKPFIRKAVIRTINKAKGIVEKEINKATRKKGRG